MSADGVQLDGFDYPIEVSQRLVADIRAGLGLSQQGFAGLIHVHPQTVSKLERGVLPMDEQLRYKLLMLRDILGIPGVSELLRYMSTNYRGEDAYWLAQAVHKVAA